MASSALAGAIAIAKKDLAIELRSRSAFLSAIVFSLLTAVAFHFAFDNADFPESELGPGVIWVIFIFSGLIGLQRSFAIEAADRAIDGLLGAPIGRGSIFTGKMAANCVFVLGVQCLSIPAVMIFYNLPGGSWILLHIGVLILATLGLTSVGTLFSSMAVNTRFADLLLPILALPFFLPVVAMSAGATELVLAQRPVGDIMPIIRVLLAFDLVFVSVSAWAFPHTIED